MLHSTHLDPRNERPVRLPALRALAGVGPPPLPDATAPRIDAATLAGLPLLCRLDAGLADWAARRAVLRQLPRHAVAIEQGSRDSGLHVLLKGAAQVVRDNPHGRPLVLDPLRPGDHFGELSAIDGQPQHAAVRCTQPSEVLVIGRADFLHLLAESPPLLQALLQATVARLRRRNRRITLLALHDVRDCVLQQLRDLAEWQDGRQVLHGRISRQAIADMIGASRAMVSRVMMELGRAGVLQGLPDGSTLLRCDAGGLAPPATAAGCGSAGH